MNDKPMNSEELAARRPGQKEYDPGEILYLISKTALSVSGVVRMSPMLTNMLPEMPDSLKGIPVIGGSRTKGVRLTKSGSKISTDLFVIVKYGSAIPQVAWDIQQAVENAVYERCGIKINEINIHVQGVEPPREEEQ